MAEASIMKKKLWESYRAADCIGHALNNELNNEIDDSIDDLMRKFKSNPHDKEI